MLHGQIRVGMAQGLVKSMTALALIEEIVLGEENLQGFVIIAYCGRIVLDLMHKQAHLIASNT